MPAQLGQHPRLNLSGYVPGKQNSLSEELIAGILGQVAENYMRPDYSAALAERGVADPRNGVQKFFGVRPTTQDVNNIMGNVNSERQTANTADYYDKITGLQAGAQKSAQEATALNRQLETMFGLMDRSQTSDRNRFDQKIARENLNLNRQSTASGIRANDAQAAKMAEEVRKMQLENEMTGGMMDNMAKETFLQNIPSVVPEEARASARAEYDIYTKEKGQPPQSYEELRAWKTLKAQAANEAAIGAQPVVPIDPVDIAERQAFEQNNPVNNMIKVLQTLTQQYMGSHPSPGTEYDYMKSRNGGQ